MKLDELVPYTPFHQMEEIPYPQVDENKEDTDLDNIEEL